jgi:A118 family predicted phage portal protein
MLPDTDLAWPPASHAPITGKLAEWDAWYAGDPDRLAAVYGGRTATGRPQAVGGVVGMFRRLWWGRTPSGNGERRDAIHLPVAADLARVSADLLYSDPPRIVVADDTTDQGTADRLAEYVDDGLHNVLASGAEVGAALGGRFHRVTVDPTLAERPFVSTVDADAAYPTFRWGRLVAVTFSRVVADLGTNRVLRHLERHELDEQGRGVVFHGLYEGTRDRLGSPRPLTEHDSTAPLAKAVDETGAVIGERTPGLHVVYVPNVTPSRLWRGHDVGMHLGRSDFDGVEPVFDAIDEAYSSLMRDVRLAKARLIVPSYMLSSNGPGKGAMFDLDREVYEVVNAPPTEDGKGAITPQQFAIRAEEHLRIVEDGIRRAIHDAGYSSSTFGVGPVGVRRRHDRDRGARPRAADLPHP